MEEQKNNKRTFSQTTVIVMLCLIFILTIISSISIYLNVDSYHELEDVKTDLWLSESKNDRLCDKINIILGYNRLDDPNNYEEKRQRLKDAGVDYGPEGKDVLK